MEICSELLVVRANNIRRLEFWFETLEISLIDWIAGKISHICGEDLWDRFRCWRIDILGAEEIRPGFCLSCRIRKSRMYGGIFRTFRCPYRLENFLRYLARAADQRRDGCLLCLTGQTVILWVPHWSGTVRFCWGRCSEKHGFGD